MEMTSFWDIAPCSLEEVDRRFRGACCLITLMMKAVCTFEMYTRLHGAISQKACHLHIYLICDSSLLLVKAVTVCYFRLFI
jgi:hypothetical protein